MCVLQIYAKAECVCFASFVSTDVLSATNTSRLVRKGGWKKVSVASANYNLNKDILGPA